MKNTHPLHTTAHSLSSKPNRPWWRLATAVASLSLASVSAVAALPARVFAPYIQVDSSTSFTSISSASGIKYFTLAFIIDDGTHHGLWEAGSTVASDSTIAPAIANLRSAGGDVIISFGGAGGSELALGITSVSTLQSVYQGIINKYGVTALDFDIEGSALDNTSANDRRNQALAGLQSANPGLFISYTLPVDPTGLPSNAIALLNNAKSHGVNVACVNIMAMDYGSSTSPSMGQKAIDATNATSSQLSSNGINSKIGITPLIGKQDTAPEVFTTTDAQTVENFAVGNSQVDRIAFWEVAIDKCGSSCSGTSQTVWQFSHIFEPFSGGTTSTVAAPTFTPGAGTYSTAQNVSISTTTSGASIRYTTNGTTPTSTTGTLYSGPVSISTTTTLKAIAYKSGSTDSSVTSGTYTISAPGDTTITSANGFFNRTLGSSQTGSFTVDFDASVSVSPSNTTFALCQGSQTAYTGLAATVRFSTTGVIDARNGGAYAAVNSFSFAANTKYHFTMTVNVATHTYSATVTAPGGSPVTIASNYAFRTEQAGVTALDTFNADVNATPGGSATFSQTTVGGGVVTPVKFSIPGTSVTASADDGNVAANTVDGSLATRWSASGDGQWIRFDIGSTKTVKLVKVAFYSGDTRTSTFDVQTSGDGTTWTTIASYTSGGTSLNLQTFDVPDTSARYVRYLGHGNSVNLWNSLTEVEVWGN
jgi:chitinase